MAISRFEFYLHYFIFNIWNHYYRTGVHKTIQQNDTNICLCIFTGKISPVSRTQSKERRLQYYIRKCIFPIIQFGNHTVYEYNDG